MNIKSPRYTITKSPLLLMQAIGFFSRLVGSSAAGIVNSTVAVWSEAIFQPLTASCATVTKNLLLLLNAIT